MRSLYGGIHPRGVDFAAAATQAIRTEELGPVVGAAAELLDVGAAKVAAPKGLEASS